MKKILLITFAFLLSIGTANADNTEYFNIKFWNKFNDEILVQHLKDVCQNNNDLKAAVLKVNEANKLVKISFANELPQIGFQGYIGEIFNSSDEIFGNSVKIPDYTEAHFLLPLTMNYEIDIWGENHLKTKAKKKQLEMIKQDEKSAYIYILSAFAVNYYNLVRVDKLIEYQKNLISLQNQIINSYKIKYEFGTANLSDIEKAEKDITFLKEDLKKYEEKRDVLENQLSVLLSDRSFENISRADFDNVKAKILIPNKIKYETIEQRPDIVKSQLDLEKIGIDVRVAKKDLLPKFILTGDIGFNMYNISSAHTFLANLGIVPSWDLFAGGRKIQTLRLQKDRYDIAIEHYEKAILTSLQESNNALYSLKTAENINKLVANRLSTDTKEMQYTLIRENAGTKDYLDLLMQKQRVIITQMQKVSSSTNEIISAINLYQALGGVDFMTSENL